MKKAMNVLASFTVAIVMVSCSNGQTSKSESIAENVNLEEFSKHLDGAQILDVRTPEEWGQGIVEGAIMNNIHSNDFEANLAKLDKNKPVAVYCKVGGRSGQAMAKMKELGFTEVYNLKGGMDAWKGAGKPTVNP